MPRKPKSGAEAGDGTMNSTPRQSGASESDSGRESMSGYFRKLYRDNPRLLKKRSNKFAFERWLADHPGHTKVPTQVKQAASNVKSNLRHKLKQRKGALAGTSADDAARQAPRVPAKVLQSLEEHIDTCLGLARQLDPNGLAEVIESLRQARNEVIVKQGKV